MNLRGKKVLVLGLGISGISIIKALHSLDAKIIVSDSKSYEDLEDLVKKIDHIPMEIHFNGDDFSFSSIDVIVKSPGIPPNSYFVIKAIENNIEIITDLELAYRYYYRENLIAITGSNGKTTSTVLTGEIFNNAGYKTFVVGNIGTAILERIPNSNKDDIFVIESSSFQLEHTLDFKPKVALITNISQDHIDWHGSYENYIKSKFKIFANQDENDYLILNYDDNKLRELKNKLVANIIWFSSKEELKEGIFLKDKNILVNYIGYENFSINIDSLKVKGIHNIENILGCIAIAITYKIEPEVIKKTIENFKGLEHRLEFVKRKNGKTFYNDSKGTNVLSSIKALEAIGAPIILIAGGYNKHTDYREFVSAFGDKVKKLILMGETGETIKEEAIKYGLPEKDIFLVDSMESAVRLANENAESGDNILLSPASASWGQYKNFEERGNDFKNMVFSLME